MPSPRPTMITLALVSAWFVLVVAAPLTSLAVDAAGSRPSAVEVDAVILAGARGLRLALAVAAASTLLATIWARVIPPALLLALVLVGRFVIAHGILALGVAPGSAAAIAALVAHTSPFAGLIVALRMRARPTALLDAAADLGAGPWVRAWTIDLRHLRPALVGAFAWTLLQALGDVIAFELAGGGRAYTLGLVIRDALVHEQAPQRAMMAMIPLLGLALVAAVLLARELGHTVIASRPNPPAPGWLRGLGWLSVAAVVAGPARLLAGPHPDGFGPSDAPLVELLGRSLALAGVVAGVAAALGFGLALAIRRAGPVAALATVLVIAPLAIPPSVLGLLSLAAASTLGLAPGLGLTAAALLGPAVGLAFVAARVLTTAIPANLAEAAADLGATGWARIRMLWLPLGQPALLVAAAVVFAWVLGQAAIPAFTSGPGGDTLAVALTIHARAGAMPLVRRWALILTAAALACALAAAAAVMLTRRRWR